MTESTLLGGHLTHHLTLTIIEWFAGRQASATTPFMRSTANSLVMPLLFLACGQNYVCTSTKRLMTHLNVHTHNTTHLSCNDSLELQKVVFLRIFLQRFVLHELQTYARKRLFYVIKVRRMMVGIEKSDVDSTRICNQGCKSPIIQGYSEYMQLFLQPCRNILCCYVKLNTSRNKLVTQ